MNKYVVSLVSPVTVLYIVIGGVAFITRFYALNGIRSKPVEEAQGLVFGLAERREWLLHL